MSTLDETTQRWVLEAKVEAYEKALAESQREAIENAADTREMAALYYTLKDGVRGMALTLRKWAVAAGGHTPSAIIASKLLELIGDEKSSYVKTEADINARTAKEAKQ